MNKLETIFKHHVAIFFKRIQEKYNIDVNDIEREWMVFNADPVFFCVYTFTRLPRKGETCGKKIKSGEYCTQHLKQNEKEKQKENEKEKYKEKEDKKEDKKEKSNIDTEDEKNKETKKSVEKLEVVKMNYKIGKYIHPPTKLAFFSKEHKVVYGKLSLQDTIIPLCDKDINVCKQYMFRYDLNLIKQCL
jgi:hypothetical protein